MSPRRLALPGRPGPGPGARRGRGLRPPRRPPATTSAPQRAAAPAAAAPAAAPVAPPGPAPAAAPAPAPRRPDPRDLEAFEASVRRYEEEGASSTAARSSSWCSEQYDEPPPHPLRALRAVHRGAGGGGAHRARRRHRPLREVPGRLPGRPRVHARRHVPAGRALLRAVERRVPPGHRPVPRGGPPRHRRGARAAARAAAELRPLHRALPAHPHRLPVLPLPPRHPVPPRLLPRRDGPGGRGHRRLPPLIERYPQSSLTCPRPGSGWATWPSTTCSPTRCARRPRPTPRLFAWPEHPLYARAIYKLGWTYYRLDDYQAAVETFARLLDHYVAAGREDRREAVRRRLAGGHPVHRHQLRRREVGRGGAGQGLLRQARAAALPGRDHGPPRRRLLRPDPLPAGGGGLPGGHPARPARGRRAAPPRPHRAGLVPRPALRRGGGRAPRPHRRLRRGLALVGGQPGRPGAAAPGPRAGGDRPAPRRRLPPRPGPALQSEGKAEAAVAEFRLAAEAYGDYLARYPRAKQAHELGYA